MITSHWLESRLLLISGLFPLFEFSSVSRCILAFMNLTTEGSMKMMFIVSSFPSNPTPFAFLSFRHLNPKHNKQTLAITRPKENPLLVSLKQHHNFQALPFTNPPISHPMYVINMLGYSTTPTAHAIHYSNFLTLKKQLDLSSTLLQSDRSACTIMYKSSQTSTNPDFTSGRPAPAWMRPS